MKILMQAALRQALPRATAALLLAVALGVLARPAAAQRPVPVVPSGGPWCGVTHDGGPVFLDLTADGRFVLNLDATTERGSVSTSGFWTKGVVQGQVVDSRFIIRQRRDETRCERERERDPRDPRSPRERCATVTVEDVTVRGVFSDANNVHGSFSGQQVYDPDGDGGDGRGGVRKKIVVGTYDAWPVGSRPCP